MPNIEHSSLPSDETHEPKGVSSAAVDKVYVADGLGSGTWKLPYLHSVEKHVDVTTTSTPIALTSASTFYPLTNDSGTGTVTTYITPSTTEVWNSTTGIFDLDAAGMVLGDSITLSCSIDIINNSANGTFIIGLETGVGGTASTINLAVIDIKTASTLEVAVEHTLEVFDSNTLDNGARFVVQSDSTGDTVVVNSFELSVNYQNPRYV